MATPVYIPEALILKPAVAQPWPKALAPRPVSIQGLGTIAAANKGTAVANATDAASAITQLNALLASLRAANIIA